MRKVLCLVAILCCMACAYASELTFAESSLLMKRASLASEAALHQDVDAVLELTHPVIYMLGMSRADLSRIMREGLAQMASMGVVAEKAVLGNPSPVYDAADQKVCFIPRVMSMRVGTKTGRSVGYLVAVKDSGDSSKWLFLDSAAFMSQPELLFKLIPGLPKNLVFPANENQFDH